MANDMPGDVLKVDSQLDELFPGAFISLNPEEETTMPVPLCAMPDQANS